MQLPFHTLDVFTDRRFGGNPLAVVHDADRLSGEAMQAIAREFNLSETVFVLKPENPAHSARIRIFTPARELSFAGHPTIGAAVLLAQLRAPATNGERDVRSRSVHVADTRARRSSSDDARSSVSARVRT